MKNYIGISRDHSGSMRSLAHLAIKDYNSKIESIKNASNSQSQDTIVSVVECGHGHHAIVHRDVVNSNVNVLKPLTRYVADAGGTPLWDSVGDLIEQFESVPDKNDPNVSFLVMAITDGHENASRRYTASSLANKIRELTLTDRWTFIFRVPRGYGRDLQRRLGIPFGNILEWDQTEKGINTAAKQDAEAFTEYFKGRGAGMRSSSTFYADLSNVSTEEVKSKLEEISSEVVILPVATSDNGAEIRPFVEKKLGKALKKGAAFYQLTKTEPVVQDYKKIVIRDKKSQNIYGGTAARRMLGLPDFGNVRLAPGNHGEYDVFIQSTSVNRKLAAGTNLLYWENAA